MQKIFQIIPFYSIFLVSLVGCNSDKDVLPNPEAVLPSPEISIQTTEAAQPLNACEPSIDCQPEVHVPPVCEQPLVDGTRILFDSNCQYKVTASSTNEVVCLSNQICTIFPGSYDIENLSNDEEWAEIKLFEKIPQNIRALHITPQNIRPDHARELVQVGFRKDFNLVIFRLTTNMEFRNSPWELTTPSWTLQDVKDFSRFVRSLGFVLVPEIKLLTHQEKFFGTLHPDLMFNSVTYDPTNENVKELIEVFLSEVIETIFPTAIHIGHDEVAGHNAHSFTKWLNEGENPLPADLFEYSVKYLHEHLQAKNIDTWLWGDMLVNPSEFPDQNPRHLHGTLPGYGSAMRFELPKEVVIVDWQYFEEGPHYRTLQVFHSEGFQVLGAVWDHEIAIDRFTTYSKSNGGLGMVLTTWGLVLPTYLESFENLANIAGEHFITQFSDDHTQ